jgi:hypothetical protein
MWWIAKEELPTSLSVLFRITHSLIDLQDSATMNFRSGLILSQANLLVGSQSQLLRLSIC